MMRQWRSRWGVVARGGPALLAAVLVLTVAAPAQAASFDCRKARKADEKAICANELLSELDDIVSMFYLRLRRYARVFDDVAILPARLLEEQRAFLWRRGKCGGREQCLLHEHRARVRELLRQWERVMRPRAHPVLEDGAVRLPFSCAQLQPWTHPPHRKACPDAPSNPELVETWQLGNGRVACAVPCMMGAYNIITRVYLLGKDGKPGAIVRFPVVEGQALQEEEEIVSPAFDAGTKMVLSFNRGRGLGDCGEKHSWRWDGSMFRLLEQRTKDACDGEPRHGWRRVWPR